MNLKWKIGIGVLAFVTVVAAIPLLFWSGSRDGASPDPQAIPRPSAKPKPVSSHPGSVDRLLDQMEFGSIAFNAPETMNIDDSPRIQLILSLSQAVDELKLSIVEEGQKSGAAVRVSDRMEARLSGYMFQITAITPETQAVSKTQLTEWSWEIHPKEKGQHELHLTLTALLEVDGRSTPRTIRTFSKLIAVNVTATQNAEMFFKNNWQWLWAAILVPVAGWLWKRTKKS